MRRECRGGREKKGGGVWHARAGCGFADASGQDSLTGAGRKGRVRECRLERMEDAPSREALAEAKRSVRSLRIALAMCALVLVLFTLIAGFYAWSTVYEREQRYMLSLAEVTERSLNAYLQSLETALAGLRREVADPAGKI